MSVVIDISRAVLVAPIAIAVAINFARQAPIAATSTDAQAAYAQADASPAENERETRDCPCPTEIENADCDYGVCGAGVVQGAAALSRPLFAVHMPTGPESAWAPHYAPDPDPPRPVI